MSQYKAYLDFSGGQNDSVSVIRLAPNEAGRARNVDLSQDGAILKRAGARRMTTVGCGAEVGMIHQVRPSQGLVKNLVAYGDKIAEWNGLDTFTELIAGLNANLVMIPVSFRNLCYFSNGVDPLLVYNPALLDPPYIFRAGTPQPSVLSKAADIAGTIGASGEILVRVRFVSVNDDTFFGEPYPENGLSVIVSGSEGVRMNIPVYPASALPFDYRVAKRVIERTTVGGGIFFEDGYVDDTTSTSDDIVKPDTQLIESAQMPDVGMRLPPPVMMPVIQYANGIVGADVNNLGSMVWSEIDEFGILPEAFPSGNQLYLDIEDYGDAAQALATLGEDLMVYCGRSYHQFYLDMSRVAYARKLGRHRLGFPGPRCVAETPDANIVWSLKGPYYINLGNPVLIGERIQTAIKEETQKGRSSAMYTIHRTQEDRKQIKFVLPTIGSPRNRIGAKYHYRRQSFNPDGFPLGHAWTFDDGFEAKSGSIFLEPATNEEQEFSGSYDGHIYLEDNGDHDDHDAEGKIRMLWETAWLDCDSPHVAKNFEGCWIYVHGAGEINLQVAWQTGFGQGPEGDATVPVGGGESLWGTMVWGVDVWSGETTKLRYFPLAKDGVGAVGKYIRFQFTQEEADQPVQIIGMVLKYEIDRDREDMLP